MTPKWVTPVALVALLVGIACIALGPPLLYAVAAASVDAELAPEQMADEEFRTQFQQEKIKALLDRFFWVFPVGCGAGLSGMIALMLVWVSRPLGDDEETQPQAEQS